RRTRGQHGVDRQRVPRDTAHNRADVARALRWGGAHRGGIPGVQGTPAAWCFRHHLGSFARRCRTTSARPLREQVLEVYTSWDVPGKATAMPSDGVCRVETGSRSLVVASHASLAGLSWCSADCTPG